MGVDSQGGGGFRLCPSSLSGALKGARLAKVDTALALGTFASDASDTAPVTIITGAGDTSRLDDLVAILATHGHVSPSGF